MSISGFVIGSGLVDVHNEDHVQSRQVSVDVGGVQYTVYAVPTMPEPPYNTPIVFNIGGGLFGSRHSCTWGGNTYHQIEYSEIYDPSKPL